MKRKLLLNLFLFLSVSLFLQAVELNVPYYEQGNDSPWADVILGNKSNVTIRQYGCTLTCVSMVVSHFEGEKLTPEEMNNWLKKNNGFDDGYDDRDGSYLGEVNLNWPALARFRSGYVYTRHNWAANPADVLLIRYYLDKDVPLIAEVLLRGAPHYIVLTGYDHEGFLMNDPEFPGENRFDNIYNISDKWGSGPSRNIYGIRVLYPPGNL
ncbi:MAG: C39 family peptidase [Spirochaetales bacterium]|nr:C39 family peptidase [Spirochaetales bacterium]